MLCRLLVYTVLGDNARNRKLLAYRGQDAQKALNLMQMLLDHSPLEVKTRHAFIIALHKLSQKSRLYPQFFTLRNVTREENAVIVGRHSEIFKGTFRGQVICLKVVELDQKLYVESRLKAYLEEAILWGYLWHPNLLPFYGMYRLGDSSGQRCLVSPWMNNGNIIEYLAHNPDVSRLLLVSEVVARDTVAGILYLHENDIVHGDLKGTNILVTSSGRACLEKVGLSTVADAYNLILTPLQGMVNIDGDVRWKAPELMLSHFLNLKSTKASDIYAFASVCYEIFTGMVPFYKVARDNAVTSHVMSGERPRLPEITLRVKNGLTDNIWVLMQDCWETDPVHRPTIQTISRRLSTDGIMLDDRSVDEEEALASTEFRKAMHSTADHFPYEDLRDISTWLPDL
ncbi:kinase-like domain-containing protein [Crucibulum laeve]|uniref:Kinase-like domain-containing protein n=1 Tax=Crucibulum laeve TaxID=68775 RepID=A0A5C3LEU4_9AGAR|nr:kinase-like domain-containing protein [Crucibulum laeve]